MPLRRKTIAAPTAATASTATTMPASAPLDRADELDASAFEAANCCCWPTVGEAEGVRAGCWLGGSVCCSEGSCEGGDVDAAEGAAVGACLRFVGGIVGKADLGAEAGALVATGGGPMAGRVPP